MHSPASTRTETRLVLGGVERESIVDGPGFRHVVFVQGCHFGCPGCHNAQLQPFIGGSSVAVEDILTEIRGNRLLDGLTLSGGEPFTQAAGCAVLAREVKALGLSVMSYSGFTWEELMAEADPDRMELLRHLDILVDGRFVLKQRNLDLLFRGSENQRLIDVPASLAAGNVVEWQQP